MIASKLLTTSIRPLSFSSNPLVSSSCVRKQGTRGQGTGRSPFVKLLTTQSLTKSSWTPQSMIKNDIKFYVKPHPRVDSKLKPETTSQSKLKSETTSQPKVDPSQGHQCEKDNRGPVTPEMVKKFCTAVGQATLDHSKTILLLAGLMHFGWPSGPELPSAGGLLLLFVELLIIAYFIIRLVTWVVDITCYIMGEDKTSSSWINRFVSSIVDSCLVCMYMPPVIRAGAKKIIDFLF